LFSWLLPTGNRWRVSEFSELPALDACASEDVRDYYLLAGGLALVLSRCSTRMAQRDFANAARAYRYLRYRLKRGEEIVLPAQVLNDLSHEIAPFADFATREAARRCLGRKVRLRIGDPAPAT